MSGGVDSSVAAARMLDAGWDVIGVTLHLWDYPEQAARSHGRCCAPEDQYDAKRVADVLGFPHFTFDRRALFEEQVVAPFVSAYLDGTTPSPCSTCNRTVKLRELFALATRLGAEAVATGHYARVDTSEAGRAWLLTGVDPDKDQSYFLYATAEGDLARLVFPLGTSTKAEVRAEAVERRLPGANKGESQELCFVGQGAHAYADFVELRSPRLIRKGAFVSEQGGELGQHQGIHHFTVGQRRGIGVALGRPVFVTKLDGDTGTVTLGSEESLLVRTATLDDLLLHPAIELPRVAMVRVRYRHKGAKGRVTQTGPHTARVDFEEPVRAVAAGQIAVFYDGDRVLGGGRIVSTDSA